MESFERFGDMKMNHMIEINERWGLGLFSETFKVKKRQTKVSQRATVKMIGLFVWSSCHGEIWV